MEFTEYQSIQTLWPPHGVQARSVLEMILKKNCLSQGQGLIIQKIRLTGSILFQTLELMAQLNTKRKFIKNKIKNQPHQGRDNIEFSVNLDRTSFIKENQI